MNDFGGRKRKKKLKISAALQTKGRASEVVMGFKAWPPSLAPSRSEG
jgi:hypothetical protein